MLWQHVALQIELRRGDIVVYPAQKVRLRIAPGRVSFVVEDERAATLPGTVEDGFRCLGHEIHERAVRLHFAGEIRKLRV